MGDRLGRHWLTVTHEAMDGDRDPLVGGIQGWHRRRDGRRQLLHRNAVALSLVMTACHVLISSDCKWDLRIQA
jgi:hypothetical protein